MRKRIVLNKFEGPLNPCDIYTKYLDQQTMERHLGFMNIEERQGRPEVAPQAVRGGQQAGVAGEGVHHVDLHGPDRRRARGPKRGAELRVARRWWATVANLGGEVCEVSVESIGKKALEVMVAEASMEVEGFVQSRQDGEVGDQHRGDLP